MDYSKFLSSKKNNIMNIGFEPGNIHKSLFDFQSVLTKWSIRKGKSAIWSGTGTGKTRMQLSWADQVVKHTGGKVLILAPLAVAKQTQNEGKLIDIDVSFDNTGTIIINNYEQLHNIDPSDFIGVVLDESSCLKNFASKYKQMLIEYFYDAKYKLCCSATPSPNDFTEIGNHAEFLNICSRSEMLSTYFVHDSGETQKWRLKGHAEQEFFKWLSTWAVMISKPSDIGYKNGGFDLPPLRMHEHIVKSDKTEGYLFHELARTLNERRQARRESIIDRCTLAAGLSKGSDESWLYWCDLNNESTMLKDMVENIIEVTGSNKNEVKEERLLGFASGKYPKLVSKPKIASMGLNFQHCHNMVFVGLSDSFEAMYQAIRRCWRFGQTEPVDVHIIISEKEGNVLQNIKTKEAKAEKMLKRMVECMSDLTRKEIQNTSKETIEYKPIKKMEVPAWM
ncbi:MAG: helicase [Deltaproteobacteria bacterium]|nr:MAG: helicase [Deltaproteobacteria bacterium]